MKELTALQMEWPKSHLNELIELKVALLNFQLTFEMKKMPQSSCSAKILSYY